MIDIIKNMKNQMKYTFYSLIMLIGLASCGNEQPILNDEENPYVVHSITQYNETHASYYCLPHYTGTGSTTQNNFFGSWFGRIVLPKGMFNVGDTIVVCECKNHIK